MAKAGQEIYNPDQRDRIVFREMAPDTNGETLRFELVASPHSGNRLHVHPRQEERFQVLSGTFGVRVGDEQRSLGRGERLVVPAGTPHGWWNDTEEDVRVMAELRPALTRKRSSRPTMGWLGTARPTGAATSTHCSSPSW